MRYIRVDLDFIHKHDPELLRRIPEYGSLLRLVWLAAFKTHSGWAAPQRGVIDTGAHTSVLPRRTWIVIEKQGISGYYVRGLVPKPEC